MSPPFHNLDTLLPFFRGAEITRDQSVSLNLVNTYGTTFPDQFGNREALTKEINAKLEESRLEFFKKATDGTVTKEDCEGSLYLHFFFPMLKRIMQVTSGVWETPPVKDGISPQASLGACMPLQRKVLITEEGKLFVCEKDAEGPCLGNVIDGIDYTKVKALLEDLSEFTSKCSTCWVAPICQTCFVQIPRETYRHGRKSTCDKKRTSAEESMMEYFKLLEHKAAYQMVIDLYGDSWVAV